MNRKALFWVKLIAIGLIAAFPGLSQAQSNKKAKDESSKKGSVLTEHSATRYQVGAKVTGGPTPCQNLVVVIPVPIDVPEQTVTLEDEKVPDSTHSLKFREQPGLKQVMATIPTLPANRELTIQVIVNVRVFRIGLPPDTTVFTIPKSPPKEAKLYLGTGPGINLKSNKIKEAVKEIVADKPNAWTEVQAIYDWVTTNIQETQTDILDAQTAFKEKAGCAEDITGLFVGMCRLHKVPARTVWVDGGVQAEFFLVDDEEKGAWFPVKLSGLKEFGQNSAPMVILEKGDDFRVPEKKEPQRFVSETMVVTGQIAPSGCSFFRGKLGGSGSPK
ncbi:MAG: transglutaminase-like domain-containing protein [Pirellulaceae bacterium]